MQPACQHNRTEVIARRDGVDYVECLDCRQIFEAEDLDPSPSKKKKTINGSRVVRLAASRGLSGCACALA